MNEYGFLNAKATVFTGNSNKESEKLMTSDISFIKNVNPVLANNQKILDEAVLDPDRFDQNAKYSMTPISHERKVLLDNQPLNEVENPTVSDVLYKTRDMPKFIDPGADGYDMWVLDNAYRQAAISQVEYASSPEELNLAMHNTPFDFSRLDNEICAVENGIFVNPENTKEVFLAQDVCMDPEKYTVIANQESIDRIREEESKELDFEPQFAPKPKRREPENDLGFSPF